MMNDVINNRQVNLWRGQQEPPTKYHIWIKDNKLLLYDGNKWVVFIDHFSGLQSIEDIRKQLDLFSRSTINNKKIIDNPILTSFDILVGKNLQTIKESDSIQKALEILDSKFIEGYSIEISEEDSGVLITIGNHSFKIIGSNAIDVRVSDKNIVIDSNALTAIKTEAPLEWTVNKALIHKDSGVKAGIYGTLVDQNRSSTFVIPKIEVNKTGHVVNIDNIGVTIRDYVEQKNNPDLNSDQQLLLSHSDQDESNFIYKASGLKFNNKSQVLTIPGQAVVNGGIEINGGNLKVAKGFKIIGDLQGSITGTATPKIHLSDIPEYGVASTSLYGHVIIADKLGQEVPLPSNINTDKNRQDLSKGVQAVAASPLMVWNAKEEAKQHAEGLFGEDFEKDNEGKYNLKWENL